MVRIVDMDVMSDGERNSEDGSLGEGLDGAGGEEVGMGMGNDKGGGFGPGVGGEARELKQLREDDEVKGEKVKRWGVVLVQGRGLDGGFSS